MGPAHNPLARRLPCPTSPRAAAFKVVKEVLRIVGFCFFLFPFSFLFFLFFFLIPESHLKKGSAARPRPVSGRQVPLRQSVQPGRPGASRLCVAQSGVAERCLAPPEAGGRRPGSWISDGIL